jgi:hypothetical protein
VVLHFIDSEWEHALFTEKFCNRLSNTFGHIAHYDRPTFYATRFSCDADQLRFLQNALRWPCWGDAAFTFCDVERAIQREIRKRKYLALYELKAAESLRSAGLAILKQLEAKYRPSATRRTEETAETMTPARGSILDHASGGSGAGQFVLRRAACSNSSFNSIQLTIISGGSYGLRGVLQRGDRRYPASYRKRRCGVARSDTS